MDTDPSQLRRLILRVVLGSFVVELLLAEAWLRLARDSSVVGLLLQPTGLVPSLLAGLALGAAVALASRFFFSTFARRLTEDLFVPLFGHTARGDVALLSLLPGLGEEILFRGVLQPEIGLLAASLVFGLMHSGLSRRLLPYGLWATVVGALLGSLYLATGNLWGCIAAHALTNAAGISWVRRLARGSSDVR